ncbi:MAG: shikimate kinase [Halanaeroarchaeum sp.]
MDGRAEAPAAGTVLNALATGTGSAFAIDEYVRATVSLGGEEVVGRVRDAPAADTALIEGAVASTLAEFGEERGATVETESAVPMAAGLKSSSAAANAAVLATLDALDRTGEVSREDAARIGVDAAREAGVTVTGAFDDASASMLGGLTITDNDRDRLVHRDAVDWHVAVYVPPDRAYSADADVERCRRVAPVAELVEELAREGRYRIAMTVNGFAFASALDRSTEPMLDALPTVPGVSLSGTGPSYVAVGGRDAVASVADVWGDRPGTVLETRTQTAGARPL